MELGFITATIVVLVSVATSEIKLTNTFDNISRPILVSFIFAWIFQGFSEEFLFRSVFQTTLEDKLGKKSAVIISSIIFMLIHLLNKNNSILALINLFLLSLLMSLLFVKTNSVFLPAAFHSFWNLTQANIFGINVSGIEIIETSVFKSGFSRPTIINGGSFGLEGSIITTIVFIILIVATYLSNKSKKANI